MTVQLTPEQLGKLAKDTTPCILDTLNISAHSSFTFVIDTYFAWIREAQNPRLIPREDALKWLDANL